MVMAAAAMSAKALTDTEQTPEGRLRTLMEGHGQILAACGPGHPLPFSTFRTLLSGDLAHLLPSGMPAEELEGIRLITEDGLFETDLFDFEQEQRVVLRALRATTRDGRSTSSTLLQAEMDQDTVFSAMKKRGMQNQQHYVNDRSALIRHPAGQETILSRLNLPSNIRQFYKPISFESAYEQWWFACPICRWPMKVTIHGSRDTASGKVRCFHRLHADKQGASYTFKIPELGKPPVLIPGDRAPRQTGTAAVLDPNGDGPLPVPQPTPLANHVALTRGVWRWTTVPGLVEIALYDALVKRGITVALWPDVDAYDLLAEGRTPQGTRFEFRIDVKDYTSPILLAKKIQADDGDAGGAQWIVVPDHREASVPLLTGVCAEFGLNVATAGDIGQMVCKKAGTQWT
ncbi:hypothetical protein [Streptomyces sp. NPDC058548]|uniref:restriction endonuclease-related protein n=1 Tax=Streptomyces sp. NPDC058548 TaxID=3346545 RepID=UPI00365FDDC8